MQDLTLVGLTEDKTKLVLVSDSGEEYALPADARLRSALRGDHARLGQLEIQMESTLRPRDIQARIRSGETPEAVAAAAQTTIDKIMGYATPVLAERAHIADRAQRSSVRRRAGDGPARLLGDAVAERLRGRNVDPDSVEWDAWRREDGRWTLVADYRSGESTRHAEFLFDAPGRYVVPEDDEAKWLVGEQTSRKGPQPRGAGSTRRLSAVSAEDELPLGEDAIGLVSDTSSADEEKTVDLSRAASAVRDDEAPHAGSDDSDQEPVETGDADWIATQASARPDVAEKTATDADEAEDASDGDDEDKPAPPKRAAKKSRGRASVPSWDEIMFGGGKSD
ncbi:MAG TPA: septation protein SepH [Nocardioidaceae bacterium]|nr:septation protein SepH [Nocardioidaceae bacterium]